MTLKHFNFRTKFHKINGKINVLIKILESTDHEVYKKNL